MMMIILKIQGEQRARVNLRLIIVMIDISIDINKVHFDVEKQRSCLFVLVSLFYNLENCELFYF